MNASVASSPGETASSIEILTLGRRRYAFGLRWTSATSRRALIPEALAAARAERADHIVLHRGFNQFGLARRGNGLNGVRSAFRRPFAGAAAMAAAAGPATLAAFPLEDGRWLVLAIDRKGFLPDGDLVIADAAAAKARVESLIAESPTSWRRKLIPADWNIAESRTVNPVGLLQRARAPRLIAPGLLAQRRLIATGAVAAVLALLPASLFIGRHLLASHPTVLLPPPPPKPLAAVWTPAGLAIDQCLSALRAAQRFNAVPGWRTTRYACQGGAGISISFIRRGDGPISAMTSLVPAAQLSDDGQSAVLALPLPALPRISATAQFPTRRRYQLTAIDLAQRLNGAFTLGVSRPSLPGEAPASEAAKSWSALSWTYRTHAPAIAWAGAIARLGSISVDVLTFTPDDNGWELTGSLYACN